MSASRSAFTGSSATRSTASRLICRPGSGNETPRRLAIVFLNIKVTGVAAMVGKGDEQVAERRRLIHADLPVPVQLQHGQEPGHDLIRSGTIRDELPEGGPVQ